MVSEGISFGFCCEVLLGLGTSLGRKVERREEREMTNWGKIGGGR
jgi:hypothetical protein